MTGYIDTLGTIVSWRAPKDVLFAELQRAIRVARIDEGLLREMLPRHAFSRAARQMADHRIIRKVQETDTEIEFQFTKEWLDANTWQYDKECTMWLDKATGSIRGTCPTLEAQAAALVSEHLGKRSAADITRLIQRVFESRKADLVSLREQGGVYFVPQAHDDLVQSTGSLLTLIGGRLLKFAIQFGDGDTHKSVAEAMTDHLRDLIAQFRESIEGVNNETQDYVVQRRTDALNDIRGKLEGYRSLLTVYAESIGTEIDSAEQALLAKMAASVSAE